jgi:SAM-dependent methyltransferase
MLALATKHDYPLVRADLEALPFAEATLAGAFARHSYLHLPKDRLGGALADVCRALRPGGLFMATLIEGRYEGRALPGDDFAGRYFACWTAPELAAVLTSADFAHVEVERVSRRRRDPYLLATARR